MQTVLARALVLMLLVIDFAGCGGGGGSDPAPAGSSSYSVSYNANGADSGSVPATVSYAENDTVTVSGNSGSLTKNGNSFIGWNTAANGTGISYAPGDTFAIGTANVTLYAMWSPIPTYSVTYDANGATSGSVPASASYVQGATVTVAGGGGLARSGYTFTGWNTAANGSGTSYVANTTFSMGTANITLYAQWTVIPTYTVSYASSGVTSGTVPAPASYAQGDTVTVSGNTGNLLLTGYSFSGWNTAANGTGTSYAPGDTFAMGAAAVTLYAQWTAIPMHGLSYNGNSATSGVVPGSSTVYENATVTVSDNTGNLIRTNYTFSGWNTAANGSGTPYAPGDSLTMGTADVILYAQWAVIPTYTVTYDGNGYTSGTLPVDSNNYLERQVVSIPVASLYRTDYRFMGWNTQADGSGTTYYPGHIFAIGNANVTLYARWALATSQTITTIDYMNVLGESGGRPSYGSAYFEKGTYAIALENTGGLSRPGYSFDGWSTEYRDGAAGILYKPGDIIPVSLSSFNYLYPHWTANTTYTVTYNGNGNDDGTVPVDTMHYENGTFARIQGNTGNLVKAGYKFRGWSTYANGAGGLYNAPQTMAITSANANVTLYAQWINIPTYTVTYANTGATNGVPPVDTAHYPQGQSVRIFDNVYGMVNTTGYPTTNNTKVTGWSYSGGSVVPGDSFNMGGADLVMTPNWGAPLATVMFNAGTRNGNLGGYYGAMAICRSAVPTGSSCSGRSKIGAFLSAMNSSPNPGDFIAWDTGVNPYAAVTGPSGTLISSTWDGLFDGGIDVSLQAAGVLPANTTWWSGMYADTPTSARGETACYFDKNWSSGASGVTARAGSSSITTAEWLGNASAYAICSTPRYIVCTCSE